MSEVVGRVDIAQHLHKQTSTERDVTQELSEAFERSPLNVAQRLQTFPRHVRRQDIARFLARYELFKLGIDLPGCVVECGVFTGGGLMSWMHFSSVLEPYNHTRRIVGFDSFSGFTSVHERDRGRYDSDFLRVQGLGTPHGLLAELQSLAAIHDRNRPLGHLSKIEFVAGDAVQTIPDYVASNPHLLISHLYLDFDLYEPTVAALEHLLPRVVGGGIVAFDELNCMEFPGETQALLERFDLSQISLRRVGMDPYITYFVRGENSR
jgi:hypothetical protein